MKQTGNETAIGYRENHGLVEAEFSDGYRVVLEKAWQEYKESLEEADFGVRPLKRPAAATAKTGT